MPNFTFYGERKQGMTNFFFLFLNLSPVPLKSTPGKFLPTFTFLVNWNKRDKV